MRLLRVLGEFTLERRIDLLACATLILAVTMAWVEARALIFGARVRFYPPEVVGLIFDQYANGEVYLRIAARMAYANTGAVGYNDTVVREDVSFTFDEGGEPYSQLWQSEQQITSDGKRFINKYVREAGPFPVPGGGAVSREMFFAPFPTECKNQEPTCEGQNRNFITSLVALPLIENSKTINLTFTSHLIGRKDYNQVASCFIHAGPTLAEALAFPGKPWTSVRCFERSQPSREDACRTIIPW